MKHENKNIKKEEEFRWVRPLLAQLGIQESNIIENEEPDFIVKKDDKIIGIELVKYIDDSLVKNFEAFNKLLRQYAEHFDEKRKIVGNYTEKAYRIKIWLHGAETPNFSNCKQIKNQLFQDLDLFLFARPDYFDSDIISRIEIDTLPNRDYSQVEVFSLGAYHEYSKQLLFKRIEEKEAKLEKYKEKPENKRLTEYWLVICFDEIEQIYIRNINLLTNVEIGYRHIFAVKGLDYCTLK